VYCGTQPAGLAQNILQERGQKSVKRLGSLLMGMGVPGQERTAKGKGKIPRPARENTLPGEKRQKAGKAREHGNKDLGKGEGESNPGKGWHPISV